jgi:hypothetical protein
LYASAEAGYVRCAAEGSHDSLGGCHPSENPHPNLSFISTLSHPKIAPFYCYHYHTLEQSSLLLDSPIIKIDPYLVRAPTMNINQSVTILTRKDPLQKFFTKLFDALPPSTRGHVVAVIGELLGTIVFLILAFAGVETASASSNKNEADGVSTATNLHTPQQLLYIALSAGFSLAITAWTFFRISGGLFNPTVSRAPRSSNDHLIFSADQRCNHRYR